MLRVAVLSALLLLLVYTLMAAAHLPAAASGGTRETAALRLEAERLAARAAALSTTLKLAAQAASATASAAAKPMDDTTLAAAALRFGAPLARASAVASARQATASAGTGAALDVLRQAAAIRSDATRPWFGLAASRAAPWVVAGAPAAAAAPGRQPRQVLVAAPADSLLQPDHAAVVEMVLDPQGVVLASSMETPMDAQAALGVTAVQLRAAAAAPAGVKGVLGLEGPARLVAARTPDGGLIAVVAVPLSAIAGAQRRAVASNAFSLFAPLAMGLLLVLVLMVQTRKADIAQTARADSERKFRLAVEGARCGIWEWDLEADQVAMSDVTGVMLGWGGGGLASGADVLGRIAPEHRDRVRAALEEAGQFGALDVSFCVHHGSGGMSWIDARGQGFGDTPSALRRHPKVIGVALDVTDERVAEQRAQTAERRLRDAIDSVSEAFVLWDRRGRLLTCNQTFREIFSLEARALKPGARRAAVLKMAELAIRAHTAGADPARPGLREIELVDGRWLQVSERRTAEGGLVMTAADITSIKRQEEARRLNEEALQHAIARLEESRRELSDLAEKYQAEKVRAESANHAKSEFLANMSHELRTPLNAINGFSEMMVAQMFGPLGDKRYAGYAADILTSGQHLLALINDILDMSKIEAGKLALHLETVDVAEMADEAARLMRNRAETAGLALTVSTPADLPTIRADARALKQVLLNLLSNAIKFTPQGGRVTVRAVALDDPSGGRLRLAVSDSGIGIATEDIGRLGRPFEQVETQHSKTQQGTGLGLALSRALVEMHGGTLEIVSQSGAGTTVTVVLPIHATERVEAPARLDATVAA
jgi:two-component system cell cycle sensor histidine kinase PleC